jgi:hypothetical protein
MGLSGGECEHTGARVVRTGCALGCWTDCPRSCPCECHRPVPARLPTPGEVIKSPHAELAIDKVAPEHREEILDLTRPEGLRSVVTIPNPFDGVEFNVDMVNHPPHYRSHPSGVECIAISRWMTFNGGNAFKYVYRAEAKNGKQDLEKAEWYLKDTLTSQTSLWLPGTNLPARKPLLLVIEHETDPHKLKFFNAVAYGAIRTALEAVHEMLAAY